MPLDFVIRFRCDQCGREDSQVASTMPKTWPVIIDKFGVHRPPAGWTSDKSSTKCPEHASRVKPASVVDIHALRGNNHG